MRRNELRAAGHRKSDTTAMTHPLVRRCSVAAALTMLVWSPMAWAQSRAAAPAGEPPGAAIVPTPPPPPFAPPPPLALPLLTNRPLQAATPPGSYTFEDLYFDLDGFTPRAEAIAVLDAAARAMLANPTLNINIEGHTCDIGSAEYNLALGDRRATAVKDYLVGRGIPASRLQTASYGEDDPEHANAHEATQRLNRRVALIVRLKP